jgi:hypothetical protein
MIIDATCDGRIWTVQREIGASSDGAAEPFGAYRWKWRAELAALKRRLLSPGSHFVVSPVAASEWHPWRVGGRWVERRVLAPWFSGGVDREQFRDPSAVDVVPDPLAEHLAAA